MPRKKPENRERDIQPLQSMKYPCPVCSGRKFKTEQGFTSHIQDEHNIFSCPKCELMFADADDLTKHKIQASHGRPEFRDKPKRKYGKPIFKRKCKSGSQPASSPAKEDSPSHMPMRSCPPSRQSPTPACHSPTQVHETAEQVLEPHSQAFEPRGQVLQSHTEIIQPRDQIVQRQDQIIRPHPRVLQPPLEVSQLPVELYHAPAEVYQAPSRAFQPPGDVYQTPTQFFRRLGQVYQTLTRFHHPSAQVVRAPDQVYQTSTQVYQAPALFSPPQPRSSPLKPRVLQPPMEVYKSTAQLYQAPAQVYQTSTPGHRTSDQGSQTPTQASQATQRPQSPMNQSIQDTTTVETNDTDIMPPSTPQTNNSATSPPIPPTPSTPTFSLIYPDIRYRWTNLEPAEQTLLLRYMLGRCHSHNRLHSQGYNVPKNADTTACVKCGKPHQNHSFTRWTTGRKAIVIDCEMVETKTNKFHLAFITAIDFLTGDVLINSYVAPSAPVTNCGITPEDMEKAISEKKAFKSKADARRALLSFLDPDTVLIGHALHNDLRCLDLIHGRIVDTSIVTSETVFYSFGSKRTLPRLWGLKALARDLLGIHIQDSPKGHNSVEDALATREVLIWCLRSPGCLKTWADRARFQHEEMLRARTREMRTTAKAGKKGGGSAEAKGGGKNPPAK
ncbi:unnamed protein product [Penicillium glandicola]